MSQAVFKTLLDKAAPPRSFKRGSHVFHRSDPVHTFFLLVEGAVRLVRHQENGSVLVIHAIHGPHIIAEASLYSKYYHCDCLCDSECAIAAMPVIRARELLIADPALSEQWSGYLANELQNARRQSELLTHARVSERLDAWIDWHGPLPDKGLWKTLAEQLNVSPEALYREIARRSKTGASLDGKPGRNAP